MVNAVTGPRLRAAAYSNSPERTRAVAAGLGRLCRGGEILLLRGDLGSGKTCFVQGLAAGLEVPPEFQVTSPTFTLHAEYPGRLLLNHLDLYRLDEPAMLEGLGIEEMLIDRRAVTAIEWPELLGGLPGGERLEVDIVDAGGGGRDISLAAYGERHARLLRTWLDNGRAGD